VFSCLLTYFTLVGTATSRGARPSPPRLEAEGAELGVRLRRDPAWLTVYAWGSIFDHVLRVASLLYHRLRMPLEISPFGYGSPSSGSTVQEILDITDAVEAARIANLTDVA